MLRAIGAPRAAAATAPTPPVVTLPMPAPAAMLTAGQNLTLTWVAPTTNTDSSAIPAGSLTYNLWEVSSGTPTLKVGGLTVTSDERMTLAVGTPCYVVTATETQGAGVTPATVDSVGSSPPFCVDVSAAPPPTPQPETPNAPTGVTGTPSS
ncbi:MAG: hypothetical protein ACREUT_01945 [Steroidobacteraceae bacterium]